MDLKNYPKFPSKILLFGEYLVLGGGSAISIPYFDFNLQKNFILQSNKEFYHKLYEFMVNLPSFNHRISSQFSIDIQNGLNYKSNIPVGYGLGSSGALVAAIYSEYILDKKLDLQNLQKELSSIENFFHDNSSGIDPLTSYIQKTILIQAKKVSNNISFKLPDKFYLIDSRIKRNAKKAIQHFKELSTSNSFNSKLTSLVELNNQIIGKLLENEDIEMLIFEFSLLQYNLFEDFVPMEIRYLWKRGLDENKYAMKLCGAGMGGMFIAYSKEKLEQINFKQIVESSPN